MTWKLPAGFAAPLHTHTYDKKVVIILGTVRGNVTAKEKLELRAGGTMDGQLNTPKVAMAEGSTFNGKIEMPKKGEKG